MIATVQLIGETLFDATRDVIKDGVSGFSFEIEDAEGTMTTPEISVKLDNVLGTYDSRVGSVIKDRVRVLVGGRPVFEGGIKEGGQKYDPDDYLLELSCAGRDASFVDALKNIKLIDLPGLAGKVVRLPINTAQPNQTIERKFVRIVDMFKLLVGEAGYDVDRATIEIDPRWMIGGVVWNRTTPVVPKDMTGYGLLQEVMKLNNARWWIETDQSFVLRPKSSIIRSRRAVAPVPLAVIKNTAQQSEDYLEMEKITWAYTKGQLDVFPEDLDHFPKAQISRSSTPKRVKDIETAFWLPFPRRHSAPWVILRSNDLDNNSYLIQSEGSGVNQQKPVDPVDILQTYYQIELQAGLSVTGEVSILDDESFFQHWMPSYLHVKLPSAGPNHFLRKVEVNLAEEKITIHAVKYVTD